MIVAMFGRTLSKKHTTLAKIIVQYQNADIYFGSASHCKLFVIISATEKRDAEGRYDVT